MNTQQEKRNKASLYQFELQAHYGLLKALDGSGSDLVQAVLKCSVSADDSKKLEYANRLWHGIFQDFKELRNLFPGHAGRFGPYEGV